VVKYTPLPTDNVSAVGSLVLAPPAVPSFAMAFSGEGMVISLDVSSDTPSARAKE